MVMANFPRLIYERYTEPGAIIKQIVNKLAAVLLEMPRGSIELVYPRFMLERSLKSLIQQHNYTDAFRLSRLHKVDLGPIVEQHLRNTNLSTELRLLLAQLQRKDLVEQFLLQLT
jgi:elongator complex protein 1